MGYATAETKVITVSRWYLDKRYWAVKIMYIADNKKGDKIWQTFRIFGTYYLNVEAEATSVRLRKELELPFIPDLQRGDPVECAHMEIISNFYLGKQYNPNKREV